VLEYLNLSSKARKIYKYKLTYIIRAKLDKKLKNFKVKVKKMSLNVLEEINSIKENLDSGVDYKEEKKKFFQVVDFIKIHEIKDEEILGKISELRYNMAKTWRPNQYSIRSGLILWTALVVFGGFLIYSTFWIWANLIGLGIWMNILYVIVLILGWLSINIGIHNLGHYIAGKLVGINFHGWVIREAVFQWALVIEYKSYLKVTFRKRQILHLSGPICTLGAPWVIYLITLNPIMIGIGIYMIVASIPVMVKKKWDYGRIFKERQLKKQYNKAQKKI